jgi:hypothetical protein
MAQGAIPNPIKGKDIQTGFGKQPKAPAASFQSPIDIIRQSARKELPPGSDVETLLKQVALLVQRNKVKLLQIANTVFLIQPQPDGSAEFHTFTIEPPQVLVERYKAGAKSLKEMGFKKGISYAQSPAFAKIAQSTGLPVQVTQTVKQVGQQMQPVYKFEVSL